MRALLELDMSQKEKFLNGEGDNWFRRNKLELKGENLDTQFLISNLKNKQIEKFLEVGCSSGVKTHELAKGLLARGWGIDPSSLAISEANKIIQQPYPSPQVEKILEFNIGTSDKLDFKDNFFDLIYFGFQACSCHGHSHVCNDDLECIVISTT